MRTTAAGILALIFCQTAISQPPVGKWVVNANGMEGELSIDSIRNGKVEGKLLGARIHGFYDEKTKCLSVARVAENGGVVQSYKGYLSSTRDQNQQIRWHLAGTFQSFSDESGTGAEFGWFAQTTRNNRK